MNDSLQRTPFGPYELARKIAHGGMAEIFLAYERELGPGAPPVVVKCILPELASDPAFVAMFVNEAQLAAQMNHPGIVKVTDFGEHGGRLFMAMEYVEGLDCWRFSRRHYPWGDNHVGLVVRIIVEVLEALEYAHGLTDVNGHSLDVVHRDLSPSNIYLSLDGAVKLGDFGIARVDSARYRRIKVIPKGKFGYMAPEQVEGMVVDRRADVYSAGVVLAELLIGQKLFSGSSQLGILLDIRDGRLDVLERNADRIPADLQLLLQGALARSPERRYASTAEFAELLRGYQQRSKVTATAAELGEQVRLAMDLRDPISSIDPAVLPPTPASDDVSSIAVAPFSDSERTGRFAGLEGVPDGTGTPVTTESAQLHAEGRYVARLESGLTVGPTSFAHVIELIYSDRIGPQTKISVNGQPFVEAAELPDLSRHLPAYTPTQDVDAVETPDRRGLLELETVAEVLLSLALKGETGLFICELGERRKEVYVRDGTPIYIGSNDPTELLGEYLVRSGQLDRIELEMALALLPKFSGHLGDTLVALGMISAIELFSQIQDQIRGRLDGLLGWRSGSYEFYRGVACRPGVLEVPIDPYAFVHDRLLGDLEQLADTGVLEQLAPCLVAPTALTGELLARLELPDELAEPIGALRGWHGVADLETVIGHVSTSLTSVLYVALETGLWTFDGPLPPWRDGLSSAGEQQQPQAGE